jgi:uncharacterized protein YrrD
VDLGAPASYLGLETGTPVYSADEQPLGKVEQVRAAPELDIFDGIVISGSGLRGHRLVGADQVQEIFERGVLLKLSAAEVTELPESGD